MWFVLVYHCFTHTFCISYFAWIFCMSAFTLWYCPHRRSNHYCLTAKWTRFSHFCVSLLGSIHCTSFNFLHTKPSVESVSGSHPKLASFNNHNVCHCIMIPLLCHFLNPILLAWPCLQKSFKLTVSYCWLWVPDILHHGVIYISIVLSNFIGQSNAPH